MAYLRWPSLTLLWLCIIAAAAAMFFGASFGQFENPLSITAIVCGCLLFFRWLTDSERWAGFYTRSPPRPIDWNDIGRSVSDYLLFTAALVWAALFVARLLTGNDSGKDLLQSASFLMAMLLTLRADHHNH
ncbi:hypothetical protein [Sandaracinobacteroides saxicola]|uniref:Uncharacterized protein n=1 Tax=Sandaracinobacteroides saxicola TaxID=2759707 RepID=A0A7G5IKN3_9SPHN|nr:hypothetical protein [Sandaracinobacteroides saxicola]QMW23925.1 hypothetical protein H3309_05490 [Sandaracinobacteroides saxicola]